MLLISDKATWTAMQSRFGQDLLFCQSLISLPLSPALTIELHSTRSDVSRDHVKVASLDCYISCSQRQSSTAYPSGFQRQRHTNVLAWAVLFACRRCALSLPILYSYVTSVYEFRQCRVGKQWPIDIIVTTHDPLEVWFRHVRLQQRLVQTAMPTQSSQKVVLLGSLSTRQRLSLSALVYNQKSY